jgi:hypothetical protein
MAALGALWTILDARGPIYRLALDGLTTGLQGQGDCTITYVPNSTCSR